MQQALLHELINILSSLQHREKESLCFLSSLVVFSLLTESKMQFHLRDLLRYDSVVSRKRKFGDK